MVMDIHLICASVKAKYFLFWDLTFHFAKSESNCPGFRLRSLSYGGQVANRRRPKADFGVSRGYAGRGRRAVLLIMLDFSSASLTKTSRAALAPLPDQTKSDRDHRPTLAGAVVKAFGLAIILGVVATAAPARALEVTGSSGFLGEWEVTATVTETASGRTKDYRGPLVMKHIGLCSQNGPEQKTGELRLQISASSQLNATLSIPGTECTASGPLSDGYIGTMICSDRQVIPLRLRVK
jgi:hypothetical protein